MENIMKQIPVLVTRGYVPLPNTEMKLDVGRMESVEAIKAAIDAHDGYIYVVSQKNP